MKSRRIAGVSVNTEVLPTREEIVNSALFAKEFYRLPKEEAIVKINKEIDKSGLFKNVAKTEPNELHNRVSEPVKKNSKPKRNK